MNRTMDIHVNGHLNLTLFQINIIYISIDMLITVMGATLSDHMQEVSSFSIDPFGPSDCDAHIWVRQHMRS